MNFLNWFKHSTGNCNAVTNLFRFRIECGKFVEIDLLFTFQRILADVLERTIGIAEKYEHLLTDSCVMSQAKKGLVTLLAEAMRDQSELFLVFKDSVVRKADEQEQQKIKSDYAHSAESSEGVYISFKDFHRTTMLAIYSEFEYCTLASLNKTMNASKALQIKVDGLRSSVSLGNSEIAIQQARNIAGALGDGDDVITDAKDIIESSKPDMTVADKSLQVIASRKAFYLGYPLSYILGEMTPGLGDTGEKDTNAIERGHKHYFYVIIKPVLKALFSLDVKFKSQNFRNLQTGVEVLEAFTRTDSDYLSTESKQMIVASVFDLNIDEERERIEEEQKEIERQQEKLRTQLQALPPQQNQTNNPNNNATPQLFR